MLVSVNSLKLVGTCTRVCQMHAQLHNGSAGLWLLYYYLFQVRFMEPPVRIGNLFVFHMV